MTAHEHRPGRVATLTVSTRQGDGPVLTRSWMVCADCADQVVAGLGPPASEVITTPEAVTAVSRGFRETPGVVISERGKS